MLAALPRDSFRLIPSGIEALSDMLTNNRNWIAEHAAHFGIEVARERFHLRNELAHELRIELAGRPAGRYIKSDAMPDGIAAQTYFIAPELLNSSPRIRTIGVYAHEFGTAGYGVIGLLDTSLAFFLALLAGNLNGGIMRLYHELVPDRKNLAISTGLIMVASVSSVMKLDSTQAMRSLC